MIFTSLFAFSLSSSLLRFAAEPSQRTHDSGSPLCDAASLFGDDDDEGLSLLQLNARSLQKPAESSKLSAGRSAPINVSCRPRSLAACCCARLANPYGWARREQELHHNFTTARPCCSQRGQSQSP